MSVETHGDLLVNKGTLVLPDLSGTDGGALVWDQSTKKVAIGAKPGEGGGAGGIPTGYYFIASRSGSVGVANNSVFPFTIRRADPKNEFDTTTYRYTPTQAGVYRASCSLRTAAGAFPTGAQMTVAIRRSGSDVLVVTVFQEASANRMQATVSGLVVVNGTTDYLDVRVFHNGSGSPSFTGGAYCWFDAHLVST